MRHVQTKVTSDAGITLCVTAHPHGGAVVLVGVLSGGNPNVWNTAIDVREWVLDAQPIRDRDTLAIARAFYGTAKNSTNPAASGSMIYDMKELIARHMA